jgi:hypothetical protein
MLDTESGRIGRQILAIPLTDGAKFLDLTVTEGGKEFQLLFEHPDIPDVPPGSHLPRREISVVTGQAAVGAFDTMTREQLLQAKDDVLAALYDLDRRPKM